MASTREQEFQTDIWKKYQKCKDYMIMQQVITRTSEQWNFYIGDQWKGLESGNERLPMLNFIKPIVNYKVSTIAQHAMTAVYSDIMQRTELQPIYEKLNKYFRVCWEKGKMDDANWRTVKRAAIQSDSYCYWGDLDPSQPPQVVDNTNIFFGDENEPDIQNQPFIIIQERMSIDEIRKRAKEKGISGEEIKSISTDNSTDNQLYNQKEVEDKVTVLLYFEKKDGVVNVARSTKGVCFEPLEPITQVKKNTGEAVKGLKSYPLASMIWEPVPNSARGYSEVRALIPNQLELNKTLARRSMAVKIGAYPRLAYDASAIENPEDLDKVGVAIAVNGGNAQSINQMISYLNATNISSDADKLSNDLLNITKDLAGASDYAMGNINPEQASGQAIIAMRDQAQVPLNEQVARNRQFVEDIALLFFDFWSTMNPNGITFSEIDNEGNAIETEISSEELMDLQPTVNIDVSQDNRWTKVAEQQTIDKLFETGNITFEEWVELTPDNSTAPKAKLQAVLDKRKKEDEETLQTEGELRPEDKQALMASIQGGGNPQEINPQEEFNPQEFLDVLLNRGVPEDDAKAILENMIEELNS